MGFRISTKIPYTGGNDIRQQILVAQLVVWLLVCLTFMDCNRGIVSLNPDTDTYFLRDHSLPSFDLNSDCQSKTRV